MPTGSALPSTNGFPIDCDSYSWPPSLPNAHAQAVSLLYFTVNFNTDADRFFFFWLATVLVYWMCIAKSLMLCLLMPNHQVLMIVFGLTQNLWW